MPMKLFIGRLPDGTTKSDLLNYFEDYGEISDCYIPSPFRGFGFITFVSSETGRHVLNRAHIYKVGMEKYINLVSEIFLRMMQIKLSLCHLVTQHFSSQ